MGRQRSESPSGAAWPCPQVPFTLAAGAGAQQEEEKALAPGPRAQGSVPSMPLLRPPLTRPCDAPSPAQPCSPPPLQTFLSTANAAKASDRPPAHTTAFYFRFSSPIFKPESIPRAGTGNLALPVNNLSHSLAKNTNGLSDPQHLRQDDRIHFAGMWERPEEVTYGKQSKSALATNTFSLRSGGWEARLNSHHLPGAARAITYLTLTPKTPLPGPGELHVTAKLHT